MIPRLEMAKRAGMTRDVGPLSVRAAFVPETLNKDGRTIDVIFTTGAAVLRSGWDQYWEELSLDPKSVRMDRLNNGAPLLDSHNSYELGGVIGVVESARLEKTRGIATVRFAKAEDDPNADAIFRKVMDGIVRNVSVGYRVHEMELVSEREGEVPTYRAIDWEPYEISMVPMGADAGSSVRSDSAKTNRCVFVTRQQEKKMADDDETTTTTTEAPKASADVAATVAARTARIEGAKQRAQEIAQEREDAIAAERLRSAEIRKIAAKSTLGEEWALKQIELGTSVDKARTLAFDEMTRADSDFNVDGTLRIEAGDDERDKFIRGASAWLFERTGTRKVIEKAKAKNPDLFKDVSFDPGEFRGCSPVDLARLSLERARVSVRGLDRMNLVGKAFTHRSTNYQTTGDFPVLLENVLGKVLLGSYTAQANTWERFCGTDQVPDFRTSNRYRTGSFPGLDVLAEHAEYKSGIIPDGAKYPLSTQRLGKMFGLSREAIINDDMGALTQTAVELGKASMRTLENAVYALLAQNGGLGPTQSDSQPFFHANRANVNATGSAISVAGLDADRVVMRAQKDPNGLDFIDLNPNVLLVPDSLKGTAQVINDSQYDPDTANKLQRPNMVRGLFGDIVGSPRLAPTSTRRYLFANPAEAAAIVVVFLEGYGRGPVLESQEGWRIDGVEWKVTLYAKAQMGDPKAAVTNAGV